MKTMHRCVHMKTNVVYGRNRYFYVLIWNIGGSSTRDIYIFLSLIILLYNLSTLNLMKVILETCCSH